MCNMKRKRNVYCTEINWTFNNSCLQALALAPRCKDGIDRCPRSPLVSPGASPQSTRKGGPTPPPLPPRRGSPTPSLLTVPAENAPPPPSYQSLSLQGEIIKSSTPPLVGTKVIDSSRYDKLLLDKTLQGRLQSPPPPISICDPLDDEDNASIFPDYTELSHLAEEPSYENTCIPSSGYMNHHIGHSPVSSLSDYSLGHRSPLVLDTSCCSRASSVDSQCSSSTPPYENINMDHIARLTSEGFPQDAVIRALGITKNDMSMAWDILHEFSSKHHSKTSTSSS
ncbi:hypothetical protein M8J77_022874 [Diaphorina citri]|nr:hypothetical protein M8J77_022874 [Diaphorina citri]